VGQPDPCRLVGLGPGIVRAAMGERGCGLREPRRLKPPRKPSDPAHASGPRPSTFHPKAVWIVCLVYLVYFVCLVHLVYSVCSVCSVYTVYSVCSDFVGAGFTPARNGFGLWFRKGPFYMRP